jgi:predicted RND superfamily exporter protein
MGIALDVSTVIIASITLGLSVDDTIHFIYGCKGDYSAESMARVMDRKGPALISTSMFLSLGFLLLLPSQFVPLSHFGLFVALNALIALLSEIMLSPGLLLTRGPAKAVV